ncbi:MAG: outer membrane protein assembly factor BamE [Alphaproteobacteria bacterium]
MRNNLAAIAAIAIVVVAGTLGACSPTMENRGNLPTAELLSQIRPGTQGKDDIGALLGSPSSTSLFGEETWYYISSREEKVAFLRPTELERKVVAIRFGSDGKVRDVRTYGLEDGREVSPVDRETPSAGNDVTILQQFLGNVGRFNKDKARGNKI